MHPLLAHKFGLRRISSHIRTKKEDITLRDTFDTVMLIRSTAHPSYCPSALLPIRPTATSDLRQLFIFVLFEGQVRLRQFLGRALGLGGRAPRLGQARGPGAQPEVHLAAVKPRASRSDGQQDGWAQVQKYTIEINKSLWTNSFMKLV